MQLTIVILILVTAAACAIKHIYKMFTHRNDGCPGCPLADVCKKKQSCSKEL